MPKCTVCHHPQRQAIDQALLAENATLAALSQQYGPSISSLFPLSFSQASAPALELETCYIPLAIHPPNQREISAKLPKNPPRSGNISEQYQLNMQCEKNVPKNPHMGRENTRRAAYAQAPPAVNCPLPVELSPPLPKTGNHQLETRNSFP